MIVLAGAPAPPIVAGVSPLGRVVFIIVNLYRWIESGLGIGRGDAK